jgi:hypothetical protein
VAEDEKRRKHWQQDNSLAAQEQSPKLKSKARKNRAEFERERLRMEAWANGGFTSGGEDDHPSGAG